MRARLACVQGDQASIVGGAINFVKELEQLLQSLEARRRSPQRAAYVVDPDDAGPFADFLTFPQYSMCAVIAAPENTGHHREGGAVAEQEASGSKPSAVADVEATMVESHANLRVLSRRRPRQLLRLVLGLQGHRLTVLHLNMSSGAHMVLYSFSLKVKLHNLLPTFPREQLQAATRWLSVQGSIDRTWCLGFRAFFFSGSCFASNRQQLAAPNSPVCLLY
jgi:hypothetical protein